MYGGLVLATVLLNYARVVLLCVICVNASRVLHNRMFAAILRAPIRFFDTNPIGTLSVHCCSTSDHVLYCLGRVLNRFSKDIGFLDDLLPFTFVQYLVVRSKITNLCDNYVCTHLLHAAATEMLGYRCNSRSC